MRFGSFPNGKALYIMNGQSDYGYPGTGYVGRDGQPHLCRTLHARPCSRHGSAEHLKDGDGNVITAHSMEELYSKMNADVADNPGMTNPPKPPVSLPPDVSIADIDSRLSEDAASRYRRDVIAKGAIRDVIALDNSEKGFETPANLIDAWCRRNDDGITDAERTELERSIVRNIYDKPDAQYSQDYFDAREMILSEADPAYVRSLSDGKRRKAISDSIYALRGGTKTEVMRPVPEKRVTGMSDILDAMHARMNDGTPTQEFGRMAVPPRPLPTPTIPKRTGDAVPLPSHAVPSPNNTGAVPRPVPVPRPPRRTPAVPLPSNAVPRPPMKSRADYDRRQHEIADYKNKLDELAKRCGIKHYHAYEMAFGTDAASDMLRKAAKRAKLTVPFPDRPNATNREIRHNTGVPLPYRQGRNVLPKPAMPTMASRLASRPVPPALPVRRPSMPVEHAGIDGNAGNGHSSRGAAANPPLPRPVPLPPHSSSAPSPLRGMDGVKKPVNAPSRTGAAGNRRDGRRFMTNSHHSEFSHAGNGNTVYAKRRRSNKAYNDKRFPKMANDTFYEMGIPWNEKSGSPMNQRRLYNDWLTTNNNLADDTPQWLRPTLEENIYATTDWHTYESDAGPVSAGDMFHDAFVRTKARMKLGLAYWLFPKKQSIGGDR